MEFFLKAFNELTGAEMYKMMQLRQDVFVIEQHCIYRDADNKDFECYHMVAMSGTQMIACCRLVPPGISYDLPSIGRVCTAKDFRMEGIGIKLMEHTMLAMETLWPGKSIAISAQSYLEKFYARFGFVSTGKSYLEDEIPHIKMICKKH